LLLLLLLCCQSLIPEVNFVVLLNPESRICGQFEQNFLSIKNLSKKAISIPLDSLIVLSTALNSLSNGVNHLCMCHQKYFLNWQKQKTHF